MKTRFNEILEYYCDQYGQTVEGALSKLRKQPLPLIRAKTIRDYLDQYPKTSLNVVAQWLNIKDHSSIVHLRDSADTYIYNPIIIDYSGFVSFGYDKVRFKHVMV